MTGSTPVVVPQLADFESALANVRQVAIETPTLHSNFCLSWLAKKFFSSVRTYKEPELIKSEAPLIA